MQRLGFQVLDANHLRDAGCRRSGTVPSLGAAGNMLDRSIGVLDGVGAEAAHDESTVAVGGIGWAEGIHSEDLLDLERSR